MNKYIQNVSVELKRLLSIVIGPSARRGCLTATPRSLLEEEEKNSNEEESFLETVTHTSIPNRDGQTFSLSAPKARLRDFPKELLSIFISRMKEKFDLKYLTIIGHQNNPYYTHECRCCLFNDIDGRAISSSPVFISRRQRERESEENKTRECSTEKIEHVEVLYISCIA